MDSMITIPKQIKVGYQKRQDTYTGQLAYIVYVDSKGITKKEKSWEGWRDKKINPDTFNNEPTSGFVLNKKVGDYRGSWDGRQAWIRVYDPRNFEFEISVNNLLFILENCSSIKGKGLEGEFVYSWDGKDLLLLPIDCSDYKSISEQQEMREKPNLKKKDFKAGYVYKYKDCSIYTYLGYNDYYDVTYTDHIEKKTFEFLKNQPVFLNEDNEFVVLEFKDFREEVSEAPDYASSLEEFRNSINGRVHVPRLKLSTDITKSSYFIFKFKDEYYCCYWYNDSNTCHMYGRFNKETFDFYYESNGWRCHDRYEFDVIKKDDGFYTIPDRFNNNQDKTLNTKITDFYEIEYVPEGE